MQPVNLDIIQLALEKCDGSSFEKFAGALFSEILGPDFIPLGGTHDWGADGVLSTVTNAKRPDVFHQYSIQEDCEDKIRKTIARLLLKGREVKTLYYATSITVPRIDIVESDLGEELNVIVKIRDGLFLKNQVNQSAATLAAYHTYLSPHVHYMQELQARPLLGTEGADNAIYVFLRNELAARESGGPTEGLADGLILWALRETSADLGEFLTRSELLEKIELDVPGIRNFLKDELSNRLNVLSRKLPSDSRPIRHHTKDDKFCIAFDIHKRMMDENLQVEAIRKNVFAVYKLRIQEQAEHATDSRISDISNLVLSSIQHCLQHEGIEFAAFLCGKSTDAVSIHKSIDAALETHDSNRKQKDEMRPIVEAILECAFNEPTDDERHYYSRIASTYTVLFCLRADPKLIQYFESMAGHFNLYVGSDVLVQSLAERFLPDSDKIVTRTLSLIRAAGGTLILTEPVLDEVHHHLISSNQEYLHHYRDSEFAITSDNIEIIDRPLIAAYFLGKLSGSSNAPQYWFQFINNYCNPRQIQNNSAKNEIRQFLMAGLGVVFESREEVKKACAHRDVGKLAARLLPHKKKPELAENDALMTHLIYARRELNNEGNTVTKFGLRTWWLTNETAITFHAKDIIEEERGEGFLMRPDYLLNFLTLLPKRREAQSMVDSLFPTLLGVHLARPDMPDHVARLHKYLKEVKTYEPARRTVLISQQSDKLKADLRTASWRRRQS